MSTISSLHQNEMKDMLMVFMGTLNASSGGEPNEACELLVYAEDRVDLFSILFSYLGYTQNVGIAEV
jgi:hypothetical protein